jgi:hypothetical protein
MCLRRPRHAPEDLLENNGELLAETPKQDGGDATRARLQGVTELPPTLEDLGVSKIDSSRWQAVASVPEDRFERYLADEQARARELTTAGLLSDAPAHRGLHRSGGVR